MRPHDIDPNEIEGLFRGPAIRTLFGRIMEPPSTTSVKDGEKRAKVADLVHYIVSKHYIVLERRFDDTGIFLKVKLDPSTNESMFDEVRTELKRYGLYPRIVQERNENFILIFPLPKRKKGRTRLNLILLIATIFTTVWAGALLWLMRGQELDSVLDIFTVLIDPVSVFMGGLTFAFPLLLILGTHEFGHYFTARRYRIDASLPYFIPVPPFLSPIGTFGALISMKEPISNKKSLVDIGAAGPIAGFIVAIPVVIIGLLLTKAYPVSADLMEGELVMIINPPLLFQGFMMLIGIPDEGTLYPTAFAGWLGLFVTALNLLPVGQLDGGHIIRGALGNRSRFVSTGALAVMVILGLTTGFTTYIFFAILILILGARHPPPLDDVSPLKTRQWFVVGLSLVIMVLTFHPVPLQQIRVEGEGVDIENQWGEHFASWEVPNFETIQLVNSGSSDKEISMEVFMDDILISPSITNKTLDVDEEGWGNIPERSYFTYRHDGWYILLMGSKKFGMEEDSKYDVPLVFGCSRDKELQSSISVTIIFTTDEGKETEMDFMLVRPSMFLELEIGDYHGSLMVNGTIWNFQGGEGATHLSITRENASGEAVFILHPLSGPWRSFSPSQVLTFAGEETDFANLEWSVSSKGPMNATFALELDKHSKDPSRENVVIYFEGPSINEGSRSIRLP